MSLQDKDRIFTNLYGYQDFGLKASQARGDWDKTADLMTVGQDAIIEGSGGEPVYQHHPMSP